MIQKKLIKNRKTKGLSQAEMAKTVAMEQTTYSRKERGISIITDDEWIRIANALDVQIEDIKEDNQITSLKNDNCTFNNNSIGIHYVNIPDYILDIILKYNKKLEEEISQLKTIKK